MEEILFHEGHDIFAGTGPLCILNRAGRVLLKPIAVAALLSGVVLSLASCGVLAPERENTEKRLQEQWGIEITSLRMSAAGHMVDFRYRVLDAAKAKALFSRENEAYLIDESSQKVLSVPNTAKIGPLRTSGDVKEGRMYWMFFGNAGGLVQPGSTVTVVIGDFRAENLVVQ